MTLLAATLIVASAASADDDQDRAMNALKRSEVLPLERVLPRIEAEFGARLLAIELQSSAQGYIYELEMITPDGRIIQIPVDAATGTVLPKASGGDRDLDDETRH
jgi:uncharacterized membrane protein YkoI